MTENGISQEVKSFLVDHIDSVMELELLLLVRAHPDREWKAADLAKELKIDPVWAGDQLAKFAARGMLSRSDGAEPQYRYAPQAPEIEATIADVAHAYVSHRVSIISLIFSKPVSTLKTFADAFRLRKDKTDG